MSFGIGPFVGALAGGYLYDTVGMTTLFRIFSMVTVAGLAVFWLSTRGVGKVGDQPSAARLQEAGDG